MAEKTTKRSIREDRSLLSWPKIALMSILLLSISSYCLFSQYSSIISKNVSANQYFVLSITTTLENASPQGKIWNLSKTEKTIGLFMNNTWQTIYLVNASYFINESGMDEDGNPIATLSFPASRILRGENFTFQITYRITLKPRSLPVISENQSGTLDEIREELKRSYCNANGPWQVNRKELRDLAFNIAGNETNVLLLLKKFILWIKNNVYYESRDLPKYPIETLNDKSGDCDDQANLFIAFCRIVGIPAYLQVGCIYLPQQDYEYTNWNGHWIIRLTRIGWHAWAMVYVPPWGWLPVDLTYASGILSDPTNAIRKAAIITHPVVQYANITETDYIASSRSYRESLLSNGFRIYEHDVMLEIEKPQQKEGARLPRLYTFVSLSASISSIRG